ncbi:hypothetical protein [Desulfocurvibacter africanus]|uniref:Uncharacterized protein n=1 Tax=Desulfocurvibacter africanus subsp. africanus str. Walvis Bay TaxID=690850 RepID=F3Z2V5_DESAF|nr:hypothetical protein [Desulfocurvibacter africanus]EGJ50272.1 hypothetical protein Desaf_1943 [Desulfocurvibacter africanus subsp. africanus str. Walvis Bay]
MRFTYAPHIVQAEDGALYGCTCCGTRLALGPVILAKDLAAKLRGFLRDHTDCPVRKAAKAELRKIAREMRQAKPRTPRQPKQRERRFSSLNDLLVDTIKQVVSEAEDGRLRIGYLTERYNARAQEHGWQPIRAVQVAARLRRWRLRVSAVEYALQGGKGKCLLIENEQFRRFAGVKE